MAKATRSTVEVEKVIKEKVDTVTLELTLEEAATLRAVTGFLLGNIQGKRRHTDNIWGALAQLGAVVPKQDSPFEDDPKFKDN